MTSIGKTNYDLMIIPFRRAAEFLDLESTRNLLLLNKFISKSLYSNDFASIIVPKILKNFYEEQENILDSYSQKFSPVFSYKDILNNIRKSTNLIVNPFGLDGLNKWIIEESEDNWQTIRDADLSSWPRNKGVCFAISGSGSLKQTIKFKQNLKEPILWFGAIIIPNQYTNGTLKCSFINDDGTMHQETTEHSKLFESSNPIEKFDCIAKIPKHTVGAEIAVSLSNNSYGIRIGYIFARIFETSINA
ncbi:unnamed protein product [Blepharisma stoltei]|uniref:Uncharacterized protein n=1 Tax=Blepharisma stoltei TaxID=1481888 RepID=A0AAU9K108_9CILI|nr:unnamed protein product [Blepharisma stoltei]